MILKDSFFLTAIGIIVGTPLALLAAGMLASVLYGVTALDAMSYLAAILGVTSIALIASAVPARRAATIDPIRALRIE